jgi:hypothetical protein
MARKWGAQVEVILTNQKVDETRFVRRPGRRLESGNRQKENTLSMVRVVRASANQAFDRVQKVSVTVQNELRVLLA